MAQMYVGNARGNTSAHRNKRLPGKSSVLTIHAVGIANSRAKSTVRATSRRVSSKCEGRMSRITWSHSGADAWNGDVITTTNGSSISTANAPIVTLERKFCGNDMLQRWDQRQPAASSTFTAPALYLPSTLRSSVSGTSLPKPCSTAAAGIPGFTGYSILPSANAA